MDPDPGAGRPSEGIPEGAAAFVERFADALVGAGMPRMPSRVFAAVLCTDEGRTTAGELARALQASPAAISGAVRYLEQVDLLRRSRDAGARRDHYSLAADVWYQAIVHREAMLRMWRSTMAAGVTALGESTRAGQRLAETDAFFAFWEDELPELMRRWTARRDELRASWSVTATQISDA